jgi:chromosome segregation ATPase
MAYVRQSQQPGPLVSVEQVRRRNAELRLELVAVMAERTRIEDQIREARQQVTSARRRLRRWVSDLDELLIKSAEIKSTTFRTLPEPVHGGPEGLKAAADEMAAHEEAVVILAPRRRSLRGSSHGTRGKYEQGCECDECLAWRARKTDQDRANRHAREVKAAQMARAA